MQLENAWMSSLPSKRWRVLWSCVIVGVLGVHVWVPLSYYVAAQGSADERFRWRMFSAIRLQRCSTRAEVAVLQSDGLQWVQMPLMSHVHASWVQLIERNRPAVVHQFFRHHCRKHPKVRRIRLLRYCSDIRTGQAMAPTHLEIDCQTGKIHQEKATP